MNTRQEATSTPHPQTWRWASALWSRLGWLKDRSERVELAAWLLAWIQRQSSGNPCCAAHARQGARYGLAGMSLDRWRVQLSSGPLGQLDALSTYARQLTGGAWRQGCGPTMLLALAAGPLAAQQWILRTGNHHPHVERWARDVAALAPLAALYQGWMTQWLSEGCRCRRILVDLPTHSVSWRTYWGKGGVTLIPSWTIPIERPDVPSREARVPSLPPVVFSMAGATREAPGPTLEEAVREVLLEVEGLPAAAARRLARALQVEVGEDAPLAAIRAALKPQVLSGCSQ